MSDSTKSTDRRTLALGLEAVLGDSYVLYNQTQVCHWNVVGPRFASLHDLFEEQYTELAAAIDEIAERVRSLGFYVRGSLSELQAVSRLVDRPLPTDGLAMLEPLIESHERLVERLHEVRGIAEELGDESTVDLMVERARVHEKTLWMLRAQAGQESASLELTADAERSAA